MVTVYGMNNKVGNISFYDPQQETSFTKPYSDETARMIDEEVRKLIDDAYEKTKDLLTLRKAEVEKLAQALLDREVLFQSDVEALIGKRPFGAIGNELGAKLRPLLAHFVEERPLFVFGNGLQLEDRQLHQLADLGAARRGADAQRAAACRAQ